MITNKLIWNIICLLVFINVCAATSEHQSSKCPKRNGALNALTAVVDGLHSMDPYHFDSIHINKETLNLTLVNVTLIGLKGCQFTHIRLDMPKMFGGVECDLTFDGDYEGDGVILSQPFQGKGQMHMTLKKIKMHGDGDIFIVRLNHCGQYMEIKNPRPKFELKENEQTKIVFYNLFDGDNAKGTGMRQLIKERPEKLFREIGAPVVDAIAEGAVEIVNEILKTVLFD